MAYDSELVDAKVPLLDEHLSETTHTRKVQKENNACIVKIIVEENQNQVIMEKLSTVPSDCSQKTCKPELISIGPYYRKDPAAGTANSVKEKFQESFFGKNEELKEQCRKKLRILAKDARTWYAKNTIGLDDDDDINNDDKFVEMLLLDGCFILEFFYLMGADLDELLKKVDDKEVVETISGFMAVDKKVSQTLIDLLLFKNQFPFFILFELYKLNPWYSDDNKKNQSIDDELLQRLMVMVKKGFVNRVPKLTPHNVAAHEYRPKHILQLVHSLCIPRHRHSKANGVVVRNTEQINTATELEQDGVRFKKIGKVYQGFFDDNANDETTLFDIDFAWGILKIPCFKIEKSTETFFRNMIEYEQNSASKHKYFTDFAWCMGQLIRSQHDVNLLRRRGIIISLMPTDDMVAKMFNKMCEGAVISNTFSGLYTKVNRFGQRPWNIWWGKLAQDFYYSPWKLISTIVGALILSLGTAVSIKNLLK